MSNTEQQYQEIIVFCKTLFAQKISDYGLSWHIFRLPSITDQIYIKLTRIRTIQEKKKQVIEDTVNEEFIGIINYCIIAQILILRDTKCLDFKLSDPQINWSYIEAIYDKVVEETKELAHMKNHDYGEAWRDLRISSIVDLMLVKIHRIKQIEDNDNELVVSEGVDAQYQDIMNYAIFCAIRKLEN